MHDVTARELKDLAGLFYSDSITSPEYHERRSEISSAQYEAGVTLNSETRGGKGVPKQLSQAAIAGQRAKGLKMTPEQRAEVGAELSKRRRAETRGRDLQIVAEVQAGQDTYNTIAERHNINPRTVTIIARRNGVHVDGHNRPARIDAARESSAEVFAQSRQRQTAEAHRRAGQLVEAFNNGSNVYDLANDEGVTVKSMRALLRKYGANVPDGRADPLRPKRTKNADDTSGS